MPIKTAPLPPRATPLHPRRRAIIVGASSGIGAALARQLALEGYTLALLARREEMLRSLCAEINTQFNETRAIAYAHDVTDYDFVPGLLQRILADLGGLDLFIYNAGISLPVGLKKFDFEKDRRTTEVNYMGALAWLNPVAAMFQSLRSGQIVGLSSVAGERGRVGNPSYNASKAALTCYLEALRNRLTRYGVNVLTVKPGFVDTAMIKDAKGTFWVISADQAAADICRAIRKRRQELYTPARWRGLMLVVRNIPSVIFRRLTF
ncbi:MAG: SDR family NAD(P)-dependent oxidoreductase [Anaerolineales bacterium]|nr:SDR family NAD(P)-dependent oxidoreductase [Anaerolineales bacterium]